MKRKILLIALSSTMSIVPIVSSYSFIKRDNSSNQQNQEIRTLKLNTNEESKENNYHVFGSQDDELSWGVRYKEILLSDEIKTKQDISLFQRDEDNNILIDEYQNPLRVKKTGLGFRFVSLYAARKYIDNYKSDVNEFNSLYPDNRIDLDHNELNDALLMFKYSTDTKESAAKNYFYNSYELLKDSLLEEVQFIENQTNLSWRIKKEMINYLSNNSTKPVSSDYESFRTADDLDNYLTASEIKIPGWLRNDSLPYYLKSIKISDNLVYENKQDFKKEIKDTRVHNVDFTIKNISKRSYAWGSVEILNKNDSSVIVKKGSAAILPGVEETYKFNLPEDSEFSLSDVQLKWNTRADFGSTSLQSAIAYNKSGEVLGKILHEEVKSNTLEFVEYKKSKDSDFIFNKEEYYNISKIKFDIQNPTRSSWGGKWTFRIRDKTTGTKIWKAPTVYLAPNTTKSFSYDLNDTNSNGLNIKNAILDWFPRYDFESATKLLSVTLYDNSGEEISKLDYNSTKKFHKEMLGFFEVNNSTELSRDIASKNLKVSYSRNKDYIVQLDRKLKFSEIMNSDITSEYYTGQSQDNIYDSIETNNIFFNSNYSFQLDNASREVLYSVGNPDRLGTVNDDDKTISVTSSSTKKNTTIDTLYNRYKKAKDLEKNYSPKLSALLSSYTRYPSTHDININPNDYKELIDADYNLSIVENFNQLTLQPDFYSGDSIEKNFALITNNPEHEVAKGSVRDVTVLVSDLVNMRELARIWGSNEFLDGVSFFNSNYKKNYNQFFSDGLNGMFTIGDKPFNQGSTLGIPSILAPISRLISADEENGIYKFQFERNVVGFPWQNNKYLMNLTIQQIKHEDSQKEILSGLGLYNFEWNPNKKEQFILINSNIINSNKEGYLNTLENIINMNDSNKVTDNKVDDLLTYLSSLFPNHDQDFIKTYKKQAVLNNNSVGITYQSGDYSLKIIFNK